MASDTRRLTMILNHKNLQKSSDPPDSWLGHKRFWISDVYLTVLFIMRFILTTWDQERAQLIGHMASYWDVATLLLLRFTHRCSLHSVSPLNCLQWRHWPLRASAHTAYFHDSGVNSLFPFSINSTWKLNMPSFCCEQRLVFWRCEPLSNTRSTQSWLCVHSGGWNMRLTYITGGGVEHSAASSKITWMLTQRVMRDVKSSLERNHCLKGVDLHLGIWCRSLLVPPRIRWRDLHDFSTDAPYVCFLSSWLIF